MIEKAGYCLSRRTSRKIGTSCLPAQFLHKRRDLFPLAARIVLCYLRPAFQLFQIIVFRVHRVPHPATPLLLISRLRRQLLVPRTSHEISRRGWSDVAAVRLRLGRIECGSEVVVGVCKRRIGEGLIGGKGVGEIEVGEVRVVRHLLVWVLRLRRHGLLHQRRCAWRRALARWNGLLHGVHRTRARLCGLPRIRAEGIKFLWVLQVRLITSRWTLSKRSDSSSVGRWGKRRRWALDEQYVLAMSYLAQEARERIMVFYSSPIVRRTKDQWMGDSKKVVASESSRSGLFTAVSLCEWEKGGCGTRSRLSHVNEGSAVGRGGSDARRL